MRLPSVASLRVVLVGAVVATTAAASGGRPVTARSAPSLAAVGTLPGHGTLVIGQMRMISLSTGWALGNQAGEDAVLRTTDGGTTWSDITPVSLHHSFALLHFSDVNHAWLGLSGLVNGERSFTVYRTQDAGRSWTKGGSILLADQLPDVVPLVAGLQFADLQHGWLTLLFRANEPTSTGVAIYATNDGGQHWQAVSITADLSATLSRNSLPIGCVKTGTSFNSPSTGWATAHCADGSMFFYVSHDGGRSWRRGELPPPAGYPANLFGSCDCASLPPRFAGTLTDGVLLFHSPDLVYATHDGGTTWRPVMLPTKYVAAAEFIDARLGWLISLAPDRRSHALAFDRLYVTHDGGDSWQPVTPDHALEGSLQFLNERDGWLIDRHANPPELYRTTDGGQTWQRLQPRLIGSPSQSA